MGSGKGFTFKVKDYNIYVYGDIENEGFMISCVGERWGHGQIHK